MPADITIKEASYEPSNGIIGSKLTLSYSGTDMNKKIVNTIRRVTLNDIPTYAFPPELIIISKNTSVFTNDYMRDHLCQLPIYDIHDNENDLVFLHPKYWDQVDYSDKERHIHEHEANMNISMSVNVKNDTEKLMNVTTNDAVIMKNNKKITMYDKKYAPLIIQLRPGQAFSCTMRSALGVGERGDIWAASADPYYDIDEENSQILAMYESKGQLDEYEYLIKTCDYILHKLKHLKLELQEQFITKKLNKTHNKIVINLMNEDHTMGELINNALQDLPEVNYSGFCKPDGYIREGNIKLECNEKSSCADAFNKAIVNLEDSFNVMKPQFVKLYAKHKKNKK